MARRTLADDIKAAVEQHDLRTMKFIVDGLRHLRRFTYKQTQHLFAISCGITADDFEALMQEIEDKDE